MNPGSSAPMAMLEPLLANLPVGLLLYEADTGDCVLANQAAANMLGASVDALRQEDLKTFARRCRLAAATLGGEVPGRHMVGLQTAPQQTITLDLLTSWTDVGGKRHLACTLLDISDHKETQETLERERALLRCVIDSASDLIFVKDQNSVYRACNKASEAFIGIPESEQIGKTDYDFFDREKADAIRKADKAVIEEGKPLHYEEWVTGRDGRRVMMDTLKSPYYDPEGKPLGLIGIGRDLTQRKRLEEERLAHLRFLENMDKVNQAIQANSDLEQMMRGVLDVVRSLFDCDRAFLLQLCDPQADAWKIPMESTKPEYPGIFATGIDISADPQIDECFRILLSAHGPVQFGPGGEHPLPNFLGESFAVKSAITTALHPKKGLTWLFGLHQCSHERVWTGAEERLFDEIGRRLQDALTSLLIHRTLGESEARYRRVFENSPIAIWEEDFSGVKKGLDDLKQKGVTDIEAWLDRHPEALRQFAEAVKIVDVNPAALALHKAATRAELLTGLVQIFTPEAFETFRRELVCLWRGGTELVDDAAVRTLAGERREVSVFFSVCAGHEETLSKVLVSLVDITDLRRNEAVNLARLHLIRFAENHSLDELLEETLNEAEKLTDSRIAFYHFVNADQKTLTLQNWSTGTKRDFCKAEGKGLHYPIAQAGVWVDCVHERKAVIHNDYASLPHRKGMPEGHAEVHRQLVVPVFRGDALKAILGVGNKSTEYTGDDVDATSLLADLAWEIAERKRTTEELDKHRDHLEELVQERTAQLAASNRELQGFTYSVSHDLRAPLRHIDGFVELLRKKTDTTLDEQGRHYLAAVSGASKKMERLIEGLLSFSQLGHHALALRKVDLHALVQDAVDELAADTTGRKIDWQIGDLPVVMGDGPTLRMVLIHLIANAVKFTRLREATRIEIGSLPTSDGDEAIVYVRDNGVGFDMAYAEKLFGVFQRLHRAEAFEGTGIGLAHVQRIIARHGGRTWAEGEVDQGATFYFSLPHR